MDSSGWQNLINAFNDLISRCCSWLVNLDEQAKSFHLFMMMGLLLMLLSMGGCQYRLNRDINQYENANLQLAQAIGKRQQDLQNIQIQEKFFKETKAKLLLLQTLQSKTQAAAALLQELGAVLPANARITRLSQHGDALNFEGKAKSNSELAIFLQSLAESAIFLDPVLISLKQSTIKSEQLEDFEVAVKWKIPVVEVVG